MSDGIEAAPGGRTPGAAGYVVLIEGPGQPSRKLHLSGTVEFGRGGGGVVLADAEVSRRHFRLISSAGAILVEDLGSTNGTRVGSGPVTGARRLAIGDVVTAGRTKIVLVDVASGAGPAAEEGTGIPSERRPAASPPPPPPPADGSAGGEGGAFPVPGTPLELVVPDPVARLVPAPNLVAGAGDAWAEMAEMGLASPRSALGRLVVRVEAAFDDPGVVVDWSGPGLVWRLPPDRPIDPLLLGLAPLVSDPAAPTRRSVVALGLAAARIGIPDPAPGLARRSVSAVGVGPAGAGLAAARSLVGYLLARCGESAVEAYLGAEFAGDPEAGERTWFGHDLDTLEAEWRALVDQIPPAGPLRGPWLGRRPGAGGVLPAVDGMDALVDTVVGAFAPADPEAWSASVRSAATEAALPAGATSGEGAWIAVITGGRAELVAGRGPFRGTVVAEVGPGARYGVASTAGHPQGLTLRALDELDLLVVEASDLPAAPTPRAASGSPAGLRRSVDSPAWRVAATDVLLDPGADPDPVGSVT